MMAFSVTFLQSYIIILLVNATLVVNRNKVVYNEKS